jgi:beta-glucanase (GH16 family)
MGGGLPLIFGIVVFIALPASAMQLVWSDEFDYFGTPDPSKWEFEIGTPDKWANDEKQNYTDRLENGRVEHGDLVIEARRDGPADMPYSSARLRSKGEGWLYGRIEIRAKMPGGQGTWPALWMLPLKITHGEIGWPDNGEIDILEHTGAEPEKILASLHTRNLNWMLGTQISQAYHLPDAVTDYHIYSLDWTPDHIIIGIDGIPYLVAPNPRTDWGDWPFDHNFYLIFNLAIGGMMGGEIDDTIFPRELRVDYVRVYQSAPAGS